MTIFVVHPVSGTAPSEDHLQVFFFVVVEHFPIWCNERSLPARLGEPAHAVCCDDGGRQLTLNYFPVGCHETFVFFIAVTILLRIKCPSVTVENLKVGKLFGTKNCRDVQILSWKLFEININLFVLKNLPNRYL